MNATRPEGIRVRDYYEALDIDFVVDLVPNKEQIYSENMPDNIEVCSEYKRLDQLVDYIRDNSDVTVMMPYLERYYQNTITFRRIFQFDQ